MPCEAVFDWMEPDEDRSLNELITAYRDKRYYKPSTRYGPIHDWESFEPPDVAEALARRRFGLFFELLREGIDE